MSAEQVILSATTTVKLAKCDLSTATDFSICQTAFVKIYFGGYRND